MTDNSTSILLGVIAAVAAQVITFLTLMFNARQSRLREERARKWQLEDRMALAKVDVAITENSARAESAAAAADKAYSEVIATISAWNAKLLNHEHETGPPP